MERQIVADSEYHGLMAQLPPGVRALAQLARLDRPIGWWLLFWPCLWGLALAGGAITHWPLILWFLVGSIAMRGAGCVYNDIVDRDLDAQVARTANRPLVAGTIGLRGAWAWLLFLCLIGLIVLMQLRGPAQMMALGSVALVAAYPFMKRITWWPQAWLGLVFSWGAPVGWMAVADASTAMLLLHLGAALWVVGYDTLYAMQDREDDALVGIKSSALRLGGHVRAGVAGFYTLAWLCWAAAVWLVRPDPLALLALLPIAAHLGWQVATIRADGDNALALFRSNRMAGLLMALACVAVGSV